MAKGGARVGAGRKANSGAFGEKTVAKRIPVSLVNGIEWLIDSWKEEKSKDSLQFVVKNLARFRSNPIHLPLFESRVSAGYPSPADDNLEASLDLNQHLIENPNTTFLVKTSGDSMKNAGINSNDILVVDRSIEPKHSSIVIAALNGELTVKRLHIEGKNITLKAENPEYPSIIITEEMDFLIWGVVTSVIHEFRN
jgi:DNA polymerase V